MQYGLLILTIYIYSFATYLFYNCHEHNIFRICKLSQHPIKDGVTPEPINTNKVLSKVCPYTDLYPLDFDKMQRSGTFVDWGSGKSYVLPSPFALDSIRIRDTLFNILPRSVTSKTLEYWYGKNWIVHPMHNAERQASNSGGVRDDTEDTKQRIFEIIQSNQ